MIPIQTVHNLFTASTYFNENRIDYSGHSKSESDAQFNSIVCVESHCIKGNHFISIVEFGYMPISDLPEYQRREGTEGALEYEDLLYQRRRLQLLIHYTLLHD